MADAKIAVSTAPMQPGTNGLIPTIAEYLKLKEWQRELEKEARQAAKSAEILEHSISDALEVNGGTLKAGDFSLRFQFVNGVPGYKGIAEKYVQPAILLAEIEATPQRRKLVIE